MGLMCRPRDCALPSLPAEIWVNHIFPLCPKSWFEPPVPLRAPVATAPIGGPAAPLAFTPPPRARAKAEGADDSDDGASTRAPSSAASSAQVTPETEPSQPPAHIVAQMDPISAGEPAMDLDGALSPPRGTLFEVFDNGQRHAIGMQGDPDDMDTDFESPRLAVPIRLVQQVLAATMRRRRRARPEFDSEEEAEEPEAPRHEEDVDDEEGMADAERFDAGLFEAADSDAEMGVGEAEEEENDDPMML
ncbi:unnamed protein product [Prorocentrum cordatum]|uniref:Uncharacterized protein n=1 Tax=Prorocentrum cordatum TaxID=2364126 RepID=A0ABN9UJ22_9DINO|nr:unnamed protein product [Polarella glacialis]